MGTWGLEPSRGQLAVNRAAWTSVARQSPFCGFIHAMSPCSLFCLTTPFEVYIRVLSPQPCYCWHQKPIHPPTIMCAF